MAHSIYCRLGPGPTTLPAWRSVFNRLSIQVHVKPQKRNKARNVPDLPSASVNMIERERETLRGRRGRHDTNSSSFSSPASDYSPSLGQVLVGQEGAFWGTRSRLAMPYNYEQLSSSTGWCHQNHWKDSSNGLMMRKKLVDMPLQQRSALYKQAECRLIWPITAMMTFADG